METKELKTLLAGLREFQKDGITQNVLNLALSNQEFLSTIISQIRKGKQYNKITEDIVSSIVELTAEGKLQGLLDALLYAQSSIVYYKIFDMIVDRTSSGQLPEKYLETIISWVQPDCYSDATLLKFIDRVAENKISRSLLLKLIKTEKFIKEMEIKAKNFLGKTINLDCYCFSKEVELKILKFDTNGTLPGFFEILIDELLAYRQKHMIARILLHDETEEEVIRLAVEEKKLQFLNILIAKKFIFFPKNTRTIVKHVLDGILPQEILQDIIRWAALTKDEVEKIIETNDENLIKFIIDCGTQTTQLRSLEENIIETKNKSIIELYLKKFYPELNLEF